MSLHSGLKFQLIKNTFRMKNYFLIYSKHSIANTRGHFNFKILTMIRKPHFIECYSDLLLENAMGIPHFSSGEPRGGGNGIFQYKSSMRKTTEPMFASPLHPSCTPNSYQMFGLSSYFTATAISCKNVQLALLTLNGD